MYFNPIITYTSVDDNDIPETDFCGINLREFDSSIDTLFHGNSSLEAIGPCSVDIDMSVDKGIVNDDIFLSVTKSDNNVDEEIFNQKLNYDLSLKNTSYSKHLTINEGDTVSLYFTESSNSPVYWSKIKWKSIVKTCYKNDTAINYIAPDIEILYNNYLKFGKKTDINLSEILSGDEDYSKDFEDFVKPELTSLPDSLIGNLNLRKGSSSKVGVVFDDFVTLIPKLSVDYDNDDINPEVNLALKDDKHTFFSVNDSLISKNMFSYTYQIADDSINGKSIEAGAFVNYEPSDVNQNILKLLKGKTTQYIDTFYYVSSKDTVVFAIYREEQEQIEIDNIDMSVSSVLNIAGIGSLYHGWGQFAWDGTKIKGGKFSDNINTDYVGLKSDDYE